MEEYQLKVTLVRLLMVTAILSFAMGIYTEDVEGKTHEEKQLEDFIKGNNYIPAEEAINQYENEQEKKVSLPKKLPFEPSHEFGLIDKDGRLKLHYMRLGEIDKYPTLDFILYIMLESELENFITSKDKVYTLSNGERAHYRVNPGQWHTLSLTKNGFGYFFGGSIRDNYDLNNLIEIAESIPTKERFNASDFLYELTNMKVKYSITDNEDKAFFNVPSKVISINGDNIHIYEYKNNEEMERDAALISKDGLKIGQSFISWVSTPHFYKKGNIIVRYVGGNKKVTKKLEKIMGQQFAGQ
jgi:hypothetical protein